MRAQRFAQFERPPKIVLRDGRRRRHETELRQAGALGIRFVDGVPRVAGTERGVAGALATLAGIVAEAAAAGTWPRLKACPAEACGWVFYDRSRNRSGRWCDSTVCGNRAKTRAYRRRRRAQAHG